MLSASSELEAAQQRIRIQRRRICQDVLERAADRRRSIRRPMPRRCSQRFATIRKRPARKFGRKVGVSRTTARCCCGAAARSCRSTKKALASRSNAKRSEPDIVLQTGLLFGNTVRDATGLLDASNFPNSQQFNEISTELNRIVEARVLPDTERTGVGGTTDSVRRLRGSADDDAPMSNRLTIIPLEVRVE